MTPIQQHEQELRVMMERAGLEAEPPSETPRWSGIVARADRHNVRVSMYGFSPSICQCSYWPTGGSCEAYRQHPDPRIALRHCLEMAGLIEDRLPVTDGDCALWLTDHCGPCNVERRADGRSVVWTLDGREVRARGSVGSVKLWSIGAATGLTARELGAILWTAERFP